jgi:hypothetical protein
MKRIARAALVNPSTQSNNPVIAVAKDIAISAGPSASALPLATSRCITVATNAAITTEMELSGPATANVKELRKATIAPAIRADRKLTEMP